MDQKKNKKKPELIDQLQVGNYVDAYHVAGKQYRLAYIIARNDKEIEVTYDGLSKKENETFKLGSTKVSFARRFTQCYTGEDYRNGKTSRDYLKYSNEECQKYIRELRDFQQQGFANMTAIEICQAVRVRHFIWLDNILSNEFNNQQLPCALEYIKQWYHFFKWYIDNFPLYYADYVRGQQNSELYLIDERVSIALCFQEVLECFSILFGSIWRVLKLENSFFYLNYEALSTNLDKFFPTPIYNGFAQQPTIADWKLYPGANDLIKCIKKTWPFYLRIMSYFRSIGGLASWEGLLKQSEGEYNYIPLKAIQKYALTQQYLNQYFPPNEQARYAKTLMDWFQMRLKNLTLQEIKDTDLDIIKDCLVDQDYLFEKAYTKEQLLRQQDEIQLELSLKFLKSQFLEKRVKGISEIKEFTERAKNEMQQGRMIRSSMQKEELIRWIRENNILELSLLGDSVHPELIKRCADIALFLCKNSSFPNEMIDKIWLQNHDKHETTQLALYEFFKVISGQLSFEGLDKLYNHINNIPISSYNENTVQMIKAFTDAALSQRFQQQMSTYPQEKKFMTFNQLWMLLQDREDQLVTSTIQDQCFQAARQLVSTTPQSKQFLNLYFGKCFELIGNHKSVYQAISFVHYILDKQFKDDPNGKKQLIKSTDAKYNIVELFVKDVEVYMERVRSHFKDQIPTDTIIWGVQTFQQNVFFRLQMLNYLLMNSELKISYDQIVRLWKTLCAQTKGSIQKKEFNKIVIAAQLESLQSTVNPTYFDREAMSTFFLQVLCNVQLNDYANFTQEDFELFSIFFRTYNVTKNALRYMNQRFIVLDLQYEGKAALWEIFQKVKDPLILEQVQTLLITLHTSLQGQAVVAKAEKVQQELMDKCLEFIQQSCPSLTQRSINLLVQLFNVFQSGPTTTPKKPFKQNQGQQSTFKAQIILPGQDPKFQEFKEPEGQTIHGWRLKLVDELKVAYKQIDIVVDSRPIDLDDQPLQNVFFPYSSIKVIVNKKVHPKDYLSQNTGTFETLFKLLNKQESTEFSTQVWDLINKLPVNVELRKRVVGCKEWKQYLDHPFFDMFYVLQIIQKQLDETFCSQFVTSDGPGLVVQRFLGLPLQFTQQPLEKNCCLTYLEVLNHPQIAKVNSDEQTQSQLRQKMLDILVALCYDIQRKQNGGAKVEAKLLKICFAMLGQNGTKQFVQNKDLGNSLIIFFCEHENMELKKEFTNQLKALYGTNESQIILKTIFESVLELVVNTNKQKSEHFFEYTCELLQREIFPLSEGHQLEWICTKLRALPFIEQNTKDCDQILIGLLKILNVFLEKYPALRERQGLFQEILGFVFENEGEERCKCKSQHSRTAAFQCLLTLLKYKKSMNTFLNSVVPLHMTSTWRTRHNSDWNIQSKFHEKSSTGYVGLYNLGCICYMNSLLQQLFMVPSFREPLLQVSEKSEGPPEENLVHQLKCLFLALKHSQKQYHNPKKFCHAFKDIEGNPMNIFEQMDVDEFCNLLMDRIEASLKGTPDEDLVKRNFGGVMSNEIIGKTCPHCSEREEPFFAVSLPVANKKTLEDCLQTIVTGDTLEGENAYNCEQCNKKVSAVKRMCIKKLPNHLILVLKRFNFDFDQMAKAKINDRIEFPFELDMEPFSQQGLRKQENRQHLSAEQPPEYFKYRLSGAVIHMGTADNGHYYSFIQDKQDLQRWFEFNDIFVSNAEAKDLVNDGFGGVDRMKSKSLYGQQFKDKSKSAYMLFYERIKPIESNKMEIEQQKFTGESAQFFEEVKDENRKFQIQRFIFSPEYFMFMQNLSKLQLQAEPVDHQIVKALVFFYLTCAVREYDKSFISNNILDLCSHIRRSPETAEWIIKCFSIPVYIKEFQMECSKRMVRKYVIRIITTAMETVQDEKLIQQMITVWISFIQDLKKSLRNSAEFYDLFYRFACIKRANCQYLMQKRVIGRMIDLFLDIYGLGAKAVKAQQEELKRTEERYRPFEGDLSAYLGQHNTADAVSHYYDDLLEKKFEKQLNMGPATSRMYMWRTVAYLLKTEGRQGVGPDDNIMLQFDPHTMQQILEEGDCKLSIRMISNIIGYLIWDNRAMTDIALDAICRQISDKEYKEYRKYMVVFKRLLQIKDTLQMPRIDSGMKQLLGAMNKQSQYFFETDICMQYILRMCFKNQAVCTWMNKNSKQWAWINQNLTQQQVPNDKLIQNNTNPSKGHHRMHNIYLPQSSSAYQKYMAWRKQQFSALQKEGPQPQTEFDSDDDLTDYPLKVDDKVDYYYQEQNQWVHATVTKLMGDYIHLQFSGRNMPSNMDIEVDSERLAPYNTLSNNNRIPGYPEMQIEAQKSDHENDTEEGNIDSHNATDSD